MSEAGSHSPPLPESTDSAEQPARVQLRRSRFTSDGGATLSSSSSIDSCKSTTTASGSRRRNMPMMYQMYESQYEDLRGTVCGPDTPDFFPVQEANIFRKALSGIDTNDQEIINVLVRHSNFQRQKILDAYEDMHEKSLLQDLEEETGGFFLEMTTALFRPAHVFDTHELHKSISNRYGDRSVAVEIACTRSVRQLKVIREQYNNDYRKQLERDIGIKVEGVFGRMLSALLCKQREDPRGGRKLDDELIEQQAVQLSQMSLDDLSRNVSFFEQLFVLRSWRHIAAVVSRADELRVDKKELEQLLRKNKAIHSETRLMLITILSVARNCQLYFAEKLRTAMTGDRPDHPTIIRIIVTRSEIDLIDIAMEYKRRYQRSLDFDIQQTCSGDYLRLMLALIAPTNVSDVE